MRLRTHIPPDPYYPDPDNLLLDYAPAEDADTPAIGSLVFTRGSTATYDGGGSPRMQTAAIDEIVYDAVSGAVRVEPETVNLLLQSENFGSGSWSTAACAVDTNTADAPDGTTTMDLIRPNTNNTNHYIYQAGWTLTANRLHTFSFFVKAGGYNYVQVSSLTGPIVAGNRFGNVDLTTGTFVGGNGWETRGRIEPWGDGIYRIFWTVLAVDSDSTNVRLCINPIPTADHDRFTAWAGDGVSGVYAWGGMVEMNGQGTSYVPTGATQAARLADSFTLSGFDIDPFVPMTLFVRLSLYRADSDVEALMLETGTGATSTGEYKIQLSTGSGQIITAGYEADGDAVQEQAGGALTDDTQYDITLMVSADRLDYIIDDDHQGSSILLDPDPTGMSPLGDLVIGDSGEQWPVLIHNIILLAGRIMPSHAREYIR